jgi:hypothetical protein
VEFQFLVHFSGTNKGLPFHDQSNKYIVASDIPGSPNQYQTKHTLFLKKGRFK